LLASHNIAKRRFDREDIVGRSFGKLAILRFSHSKKCTARNGHYFYYICRCGCGKESVGERHDLIRGSKKSCGCLFKYSPGEGSFNAVFNLYLRQAENRGYAFHLDKKTFSELTKSPCTYCGDPPSNKYRVRGGNGDYIYSGVDRIDPSIGYTKENSVACCGTCNQMKWDMPREVFLRHVEKIMAKSKRRIE
jgi:hypothetical protein